MNNQRSKICTFGLLILLLFLSGCSGGRNSRKPDLAGWDGSTMYTFQGLAPTKKPSPLHQGLTLASIIFLVVAIKRIPIRTANKRR